MNFDFKEIVSQKLSFDKQFNKATNIIFDQHCCVNLRPRYLLFTYIIIALGIVLVPFYLKYTKSPAEFKKYYNATMDTFMNVGGVKLDWWSVTHFMFYIILGFAFPHLWKLLLLCSISWELLEYFTGCVEKLVKDDKDIIYWHGKWSDLFVNTSGFIVGLFIRYVITMLFVCK